MTCSRLNPNNGFEIRAGIKQIIIPQGSASKYEEVYFSPAFTKTNVAVVMTDNDWRTPHDFIPKLSVLQKNQSKCTLNASLPAAQSSATDINVGWIAIAW